MYLSRVEIDLTRHESMKALYNLERLHGMIECSFPGERQRKLWRIDNLSGGKNLLLLSSDSPANNILPEQIGFRNSVWETKSYDKLLSNIKNETKWHFKLTANPVKSIPMGNGKRGKVKAITIVSQQREWLKNQAEKHGFSLQDGQFDIVENEWRIIKKEKREIRILAATFEGILCVEEAERFIPVLTCGIGREKAYGMGLLTVIPHG